MAFFFFFFATLYPRAKVVSPGSPSAGSLGFQHRNAAVVWAEVSLESGVADLTMAGSHLAEASV